MGTLKKLGAKVMKRLGIKKKKKKKPVPVHLGIAIAAKKKRKADLEKVAGK
jgi:hypothetical protein